MTHPQYGKPETWPHRIPPTKDWTMVDGYEERPAGIDPRVALFQRYCFGGLTDGSHFWESYGAWDWLCLLCHRSNGDYPVGREYAFDQAHQHLRDIHDEVSE
jgi:hypothetical protein